MATVKLIIRENKINAQGECVIYVKYTHDQQYTLFSTGEKIAPEHWDAKNQRVRKSYRGFTALNEVLQVKTEGIKEVARIAKQNKVEPSLEYVKAALEKEKSQASKESPDFITLFTSFIEETAPSKVHGTNKHYKSTLNHLKNFAAHKKFKITLERINMEFYDRFLHYLTGELKLGAGTVNNQIKRLKVFLGYLTERGLYTDVSYKKFKTIRQTETDIVYLTQKELDALYDFDLSSNKRLEHVRDLLILACTTGLRHSDFSALQPENIKETYLVIRTKKTKDSLKIPLNRYSSAILSKYEGKPPGLSQQKFNDYVKEVGQVCGIDDPTEMIKYIGTKRVEKTVPKYELLSSHTGRRTFITLSLEKGMRVETVMKISGHKDMKTLMRYVKITDKIKEVEMNQAWG